MRVLPNAPITTMKRGCVGCDGCDGYNLAFAGKTADPGVTESQPAIGELPHPRFLGSVLEKDSTMRVSACRRHPRR
jgi:hypothetical protein